MSSASLRLPPYSPFLHHPILHSFACFCSFCVFPGLIFADAFRNPWVAPRRHFIRGPLHEAAYTCLRDPRVAEARYAKITPPPLASDLTQGVGRSLAVRESGCASLPRLRAAARCLVICGPAPSRALTRSSQLGLGRPRQRPRETQQALDDGHLP
jgi:hypothetical protein